MFAAIAGGSPENARESRKRHGRADEFEFTENNRQTPRRSRASLIAGADQEFDAWRESGAAVSRRARRPMEAVRMSGVGDFSYLRPRFAKGISANAQQRLRKCTISM
ncbi:hypothetical protein ACRU43_13040 [Mycobacterium colombiense]